jgi:hypothetical protein
MRSFLVIPALVLGLMPLACGGSEPTPTDPNAANGGQYGAQPNGQYGTQPSGQYGAPANGQYQQPANGQYQQPAAGQYQQPGATQPGATQPGATQPAAGGFPAIPGMGGQTSSTGAATPLPMAAMLTPALQAIAASDAQGMTPDGQSFAGQFQAGQTLEQPINIQAGKCYTIVGVGAGVTQLDIMLVAQQAPMPAITLAQSNTQGANASLGGKGQCFRNPLPIGGPGKIILKATAGAGIAAAQVFVK